ncbi:MAG: hypothetical protein WDN06_04295 [Asticcacaulis sp.]
MKFILAAMVLALGCLAGMAEAQSGPSFACPSPGHVETIICNDAGLSVMDRDMAELFAAARTDALGTGPSRQLDLQRAFLDERAKTCADGQWQTYGMADATACVRSQTRGRLKELAIAALFTDTDKALSILRADDPEAAPFYDAVYRYATIGDAARRRQVVKTLLSPSFHPQYDIDTIDKAVADDAAFSDYVILTVMQGGDFEFTIPCGALVRRPGLTAMLGSHFASSMDGRSPVSDCEDMQPPPPEIQSFSTLVWAAQPDCDGTIRFSYFREFTQLQTAIGLHQMDYVEPEKGRPSRSPAVFTAVHAGDIAAVETALTQYYTGQFNLSLDAAQADARMAIERMIFDAFNAYPDCVTG